MTQDILTKHIELNTFIRVIVKAAATGGTAKRIIRAEAVKVNGQIETRNKKKLHAGDVVEYLGKSYEVREEYLR